MREREAPLKGKGVFLWERDGVWTATPWRMVDGSRS
jgi:hypothetical protein